MCFGGDTKTQDSNQSSVTNQNTSGTASSAPTNPNIDPAVSGLVQGATSLANTPLSLYQGNLVAGLTDNQNTAANTYGGVSSLAQPSLAQAGASYGNAANPIGAYNFDPNTYMSPYLNDVVNATSANIDQSNAREQNDFSGGAAAAGALGNDRTGIEKAVLAGQQSLAKGQTIGNLLNNGYNSAVSNENTANSLDLQRQAYNNSSSLAAGNAYAGLGQQALGATGSLFNAGTAQQQVNQEQLSVPYQQYLQSMAYPYQNLDFLSQILSGAAGTSGTTTNSTGSLSGTTNSTGQQTGNTQKDMGGQLVGAGLSLASMFLKDGGRTSLADGGLPTVPQIVSYVPAIQPSGRAGLSPPGSMSLGNAGSGGQSGSIFDPNMFADSGKSQSDMDAGKGLGTQIGNVGKSLFDPGGIFNSGVGEANGGGDFIGTSADQGAGFLGGIGDFLGGLKTGGRASLADGGAFYDGEDAPIAPTGASAMTLADTPIDWQPQATNFAPAPSAAPQGGSLAQDTATDYTPPASLGGAGLVPDGSEPTWDDGTPVTTGGASLASGSGWGGNMTHPAHIIQQLHTATPDWRRALLTAGVGMMGANTGNGLSDIGAGLQSGVKNYYDQLDRDNHPEVDHSGPTSIIRYADGTMVDTGIPTEAAINAQATNAYRITNAQQMSADRQARIQAQRDTNANTVAERAAEAAQRAKDRETQLRIAGMNANQGRYTYQPATQDDPVSGKPVAGYLRLSTRGDEAPQFISGYTPMKGQGGAGGMQGGREGVMFNRVVSAGNAATAAAKNIMELPSDTNSGWFAGRHQGPGLLGATKESLTNTLTSQDVQDYNSMVPGITRNLGALETQGLAVPNSMTHSMDGVLLKAGDTEVTKLRKMAEMRQIIETNLEPNLSNPRVPPEQKALVTKIIGQIQQTIPFTHHDITTLERSGTGTSLSDVAGKRGLGGGNTVSTKAQFDALPSGTVYTSKDGKQYRKP